MNSVSANTEELKQADDFFESFAEDLQEEQRLADNQYRHCFDEENGEVIFNNVTEDDILHNEYLYKYVMFFSDETEINSYITELRQVAKGCKLTADFDRKMNAYKRQAVKKLREAEREKANQAFIKRAESFPEWWDGQNIDEDVFCKGFLENREMKCINNLLYDVRGLLDEKSVENEIYYKIKDFCKKNIGDKIKAIIRTLKIKCYSEPLPIDINTIHLQNGTLKTDGSFTNGKYFCVNRLNVNMPSEYRKPERWLKFVNELLYEEDIPTLQEYMGYCLIPCTKAQKMLMLIGNGGEGKSRIGIVLSNIMGFGSYVTGEVKDFDNGSKARFSREKLVSKLLFIDDDLDMSALVGTSFLKQLITAEIPLEVEPKGSPSFQTMLYSRVIAFGNGAISSLYDKSEGFYRRQIILTAKPKPENRQDDSFLTDKLLAEKEQIFLWAFYGLQRLISNNFMFTISEKAKQSLEESKRESCNIIEFMESGHDFCFDNNAQIQIRELRWAYESWCSLNGIEPLKPKTFTKFLRENSAKYNIIYTENAVNHSGQRARGFKGIRYLKTYQMID
ncbi:MAG: DUF5906 domain-containing protein [Hominimerdicola sp.]